MFAISPTDNNWLTFLKENKLNSFVNFWTPTPWNIKGMKLNTKLYFMLKSPVRKLAGYGEFVEYKTMSVENAWRDYGLRNGIENKDKFYNTIIRYVNKHSTLYTESINLGSHLIGCIILKNIEFWDEKDFRNPNDLGINFPKQIVKIKYFNEYDPFYNINSNGFQIINEPRENKKSLNSSRYGQGNFKGQILKAYNNKCCVTNDKTPELLEAAHIQQYKNSASNHIQNGLLLRVDIHKLYDNYLIYIDENFTINISSTLKETDYWKYNGHKIDLPNLQENYPSINALLLRKELFRE